MHVLCMKVYVRRAMCVRVFYTRCVICAEHVRANTPTRIWDTHTRGESTRVWRLLKYWIIAG